MPELPERTIRVVEIRFAYDGQGDWLATAVVEVDGERREVELGSYSPEDRAVIEALFALVERRA